MEKVAVKVARAMECSIARNEYIAKETSSSHCKVGTLSAWTEKI